MGGIDGITARTQPLVQAGAPTLSRRIAGSIEAGALGEDGLGHLRPLWADAPTPLNGTPFVTGGLIGETRACTTAWW